MTDDEQGSRRPGRGGAGRLAPHVDALPDAPSMPARQRVAKAMARAGLCSRRDAEAWVLAGRVSLNGTVLTSPAIDIGPRDAVLVDGAALPAAEKTRLFMFHKPRGLVTSDHDPEGRRTIFDHLAEAWPEGPRVVTVGRLDINTEGLLLLTNDGGLARVLELPQTGWTRRYRVRAKGTTDQGVLDGLREGVTVEGMDYAGIEAVLDRTQGANCWLTMGLREGKNREVKRVLEHIGLEVNRLIRLSFGPFQLSDLPEGEVAEVKTRVLRDQLGETLAAEAGVDFQEADEAIVFTPVREAKGGGFKNGASADRGSNKSLSKTSASRDRPPRQAADPPVRTPRGGRPDASRSDRRAAPSRAKREGDTRGAGIDGRDVPPAKRQRPAAGPRRHVSALRAAAPVDGGPRRRTERTSTRDAHDRTVSVERVQRVSEPEPERSRPQSSRPQSSRSERGGSGAAPSGGRGTRRSDGEDATRAPRRESRAPREHGAAPSPARGASPAARGKRERVLRSGGTQAAAPHRDVSARDRDARDRSAQDRNARGREARGRDATDERRQSAARERSPGGDAARPRDKATRDTGSAGTRGRPARDRRPRAAGEDQRAPDQGGQDRDRQDRSRQDQGGTRRDAPKRGASSGGAPRSANRRSEAVGGEPRRSQPSRERQAGNRPARGGARPGAGARGSERPPKDGGRSGNGGGGKGGGGSKPAGRPKR